MILRDRYGTSFDLASILVAGATLLDRWNGKIAKRIGTRPSALHSTFHFRRKSRRIASFSHLQIDRQTDRQTDGRTDRQTDRQIDR